MRLKKYPEAKNREDVDKFRLKQDMDKYIPEEDALKILAHYKEKTKEDKPNLLYFGLFCIANFGLRVSECILLKFKHIEKCKNGFVLIPTLKKRLKKESFIPEKKISCSENLCPIILEHIKMIKKNFIHNKDNWLFPGKSHNSHICRHTLQNAFSDAVIELSLNRKYSIHSLRHYRGTLLYRLTKDIMLVKNEMRHSNINTTQLYVHIVQMEENMEKLRKMKGLI